MAKKGVVERRPPVTDRQKQLMLAVLIRNQSAFESVRRKLLPGHFSDMEAGYALLWECVLSYYEEYDVLPEEQYLLAGIEKRLEEDGDLLTPKGIQKLDRFIEAAFATPYVKLNVKAAVGLAQKFLQDKLAEQVKNMFSSEYDPPSNIADVVRQLSDEAESVSVLQPQGSMPPFPTGWKPTTLAKIKTGIACFDDFLNGGACADEVYGLLAPYGTCKTTLAVQLSIEGARREYDAWRRGGKEGKPKLWYAGFYEENVDPAILLRAISYVGQIPRSSLEDVNNGGKLSTSDNLAPYEKKMFESQIKAGRKVRGEKERFEHAMRVLNRNWRCLDMSGGDKNYPSRGRGGIAELASIIRNDVETHGETVGGVCVDYAGAVAKAQMASDGADTGDIRHYVGRIPLELKRQLAIKYSCPVWVFHQLSGQSNSKGTSVVQHHTDAAEAKNFAENLDFCFTAGMKTHDELCLLACTKARRAANKQETVIRVDGSFCTVRDTNGLYVLDRAGRKIVPRKEFNKVIDIKAEGFDPRPSTAANHTNLISGR